MNWSHRFFCGKLNGAAWPTWCRFLGENKNNVIVIHCKVPLLRFSVEGNIGATNVKQTFVLIRYWVQRDFCLQISCNGVTTFTRFVDSIVLKKPEMEPGSGWVGYSPGAMFKSNTVAYQKALSESRAN